MDEAESHPAYPRYKAFENVTNAELVQLTLQLRRCRRVSPGDTALIGQLEERMEALHKVMNIAILEFAWLVHQETCNCTREDQGLPPLEQPQPGQQQPGQPQPGQEQPGEEQKEQEERPAQERQQE